MRKAGLSPRQQTKNNTFRLRKPRRKFAEAFTNEEEQIVFNDIATNSPEENNLLSGSDKNKLSIPLLSLQNTVLKKNDQIKIRNQLSDEEIDCVNDYENQYECENEWNEYDENDYEYDENQAIDYESEDSGFENTANTLLQSEPQQYDNNDTTYNFPGKAGPYFQNYTHFLLFMWVTKHQIGISVNLLSKIYNNEYK